MLFERLVVTSVRPHPAFHRAQRACQLHPVTCQACCCCGSLSGAVGHAAPTDTSFCCLCAQIEPSHGRVRSSAGSCSTASSAAAGACRSTIGTRYVNPSICSPSSHHQGSALTWLVSPSAFFRPAQLPVRQSRYSRQTGVRWAAGHLSLPKLITGEHIGIYAVIRALRQTTF